MRSLIRRKDRTADPAPSRLAWRIERLMLTPSVRLFLRAGVPFVLAFGAVGLWFAQPENRQLVNDQVAGAKTAVAQRPEFMVDLMVIDGAGTELADDIRVAVPIDFPITSFDLDLEAIRTTVTALDPVHSAAVRIRPGGILQIDVKERIPVLLWRGPEGLKLLDETGHSISEAQSRSAFADLPVIAGEGADEAVESALTLIAAGSPLRTRWRGLTRVGERRWDVVLDRDQRIMLPENGARQALERVIVLHEAHDLLNRDVVAVDMRIAARPTLRMSQNAIEGLRDIRLDGSLFSNSQ